MLDNTKRNAFPPLFFTVCLQGHARLPVKENLRLVISLLSSKIFLYFFKLSQEGTLPRRIFGDFLLVTTTSCIVVPLENRRYIVFQTITTVNYHPSKAQNSIFLHLHRRSIARCYCLAPSLQWSRTISLGIKDTSRDFRRSGPLSWQTSFSLRFQAAVGKWTIKKVIMIRKVE